MKLSNIRLSKPTVVLMTLILLVGISAFKLNDKTENNRKPRASTEIIDSLQSIAAFGEVYKVLMSPRCMNCHPAGDVPLQGDDSHIHAMLPKRGKDGKGISAMKCANCHQPTNIPGPNNPPGNPKWALPPADMKMVFEGKSPRELALQIMDYNQNGHKDKKKLIEHARDTLVKAGWTMEGRTPPPLPYDEFVKVWDTWINTGGFAPEK